MFSMVGTADTTMMENNTMEEEASEVMQDISENVSDMETDKQKEQERAPKQNTQETATVTSDTTSLEQKKIPNEHQDISQTLVKALFQTDSVTSEKGSKEVRSTLIKVSTKEDELPPQEMILVEQGLSEGATHLEKAKVWLAHDQHTTTVSTDDAATQQNSTNLDDQSTKVNNTASETDGAINSRKAMVTLANTKLPCKTTNNLLLRSPIPTPPLLEKWQPMKRIRWRYRRWHQLRPRKQLPSKLQQNLWNSQPSCCQKNGMHYMMSGSILQ